MKEKVLYCNTCGYTDNLNLDDKGILCPRCELTYLIMSHREIIKEKQTYKHTCLRCGRTWESKLENPSVCYYCNNVYWNKPRKVAVIKA